MPDIRDWLVDPGSLTRRLQIACAGQFRIRLLQQDWGRASRDESRLLSLRAGARVSVREVQLLCHDQPCVFARTLIPMSSLHGKYRHLTRLGTRSLGGVLFSDRKIRRGEIQLAHIRTGQLLFEKIIRDQAAIPAFICGRRSLFYLETGPLLLTEFFLHHMHFPTIK